MNLISSTRQPKFRAIQLMVNQYGNPLTVDEAQAISPVRKQPFKKFAVENGPTYLVTGHHLNYSQDQLIRSIQEQTELPCGIETIQVPALEKESGKYSQKKAS